MTDPTLPRAQAADAAQASTPAPRRALVLGGSGAVGSAVVEQLRARDVQTHFTFHRSAIRSQTLARSTQSFAHLVDFRRSDALELLFAELKRDGALPDVLIHCAGLLDTEPMAEMALSAFDEAYQVNCRAAAQAAQLAADGMQAGGDIVLVGALDRGQSLPVPAAFAACQGMLSGLAMALAKELGPRQIRVNLLTLGLLDQGLSLALPEAVRKQYLEFSALRRFGTPAEAANAICWLALENRYMSGKVAAFNGGI